MLILDTDHLSAFDRSTTAGHTLMARLTASTEGVATTIISVEEQLRGRLAQLNRLREPQSMIELYRKFQDTVEGFPRWRILSWTQDVANTFDALRQLKLGLGTMDLKIASVVLANNSMLLSRNLRDFRRVPELKVEDWLT